MTEKHVVAYSREQLAEIYGRPLPRWIGTAAVGFAIVGIAIFVAGLFVSPYRAWRSLLVAWNFFATLASAGVMLVAVQRIVTARWSRPIVRLLEGFVAFLPLAFVLLALMVLVGRDYIFPWTHETPQAIERRMYLDPLFFTLRTLVTFGLITALSLWFVWTSVRLDVGVLPDWGSRWAHGLRERMRRGYGDERRELFRTHSRQGVIAVGLALVFGYGWSFLAMDLSMTLDLHYEGTLYGWWFFMGGMLAAVMLFAVMLMGWRKLLGVDDLIIIEHFHDLGKLAFAFTAFWGYLTFSQYLIIWYGNMAFETHWMRLRLIDPWIVPTTAVVFMVFVLPFFGLISKAAKVFLPTFALFATISLLGVYLLRVVEAYPSLFYPSEEVVWGFWELGVLLGVAGLFGWSYLAFVNAFPRFRAVLMTSPYRDEVQVPYDPETMEPLPAHE